MDILIRSFKCIEAGMNVIIGNMQPRLTLSLLQILEIIVSNFQYSITNNFFITVQYGSLSASLSDLCAYTHTWWIEESFSYASNSAWNCISLNKKVCYSAKSLYLLLNFFVFKHSSFKNPYYIHTATIPILLLLSYYVP